MLLRLILCVCVRDGCPGRQAVVGQDVCSYIYTTNHTHNMWYVIFALLALLRFTVSIPFSFHPHPLALLPRRLLILRLLSRLLLLFQFFAAAHLVSVESPLLRKFNLIVRSFTWREQFQWNFKPLSENRIFSRILHRVIKGRSIYMGVLYTHSTIMWAGENFPFIYYYFSCVEVSKIFFLFLDKLCHRHTFLLIC